MAALVVLEVSTTLGAGAAFLAGAAAAALAAEGSATEASKSD